MNVGIEFIMKNHEELMVEIRDKENKTDEEIFYLVCSFMRTAEELCLDKKESWNKLVEYLDNEGFEISQR